MTPAGVRSNPLDSPFRRCRREVLMTVQNPLPAFFLKLRGVFLLRSDAAIPPYAALCVRISKNTLPITAYLKFLNQSTPKREQCQELRDNCSCFVMYYSVKSRTQRLFLQRKRELYELFLFIQNGAFSWNYRRRD